MFGAAVFIAVVISIFIVLIIWYSKLKKIKRSIPDIELNTREDLKKINFDENYVERRLIKKNDQTKKEIYRGGYGGERTTITTRVGGRGEQQDKGERVGTDEDINVKSRLPSKSGERDGVSLPTDNKFNWD